MMSFEVDSCLIGSQWSFLEDGCDVFSGWGVSEHPGSGTLHILQFSGCGRETVGNAIAIRR